MKIFWIVFLGCLACSSEVEMKVPTDWPDKVSSLKEGLKVVHSTDTVYASMNRKDPDFRGKFQLQFSTSVSSLDGDVKIKEFGGYIWEDGTWKAVSIYGRPFNSREFDKWYGGENGWIRKGKTYTDPDNWLMKGDRLTNDTIRSLFYFIGTNEDGEKVVGAKEIVGITNFKK
ncbi:MAG: hypothetical protein NXI10_13725 [bacterium]|nr:hypothetical protein [bacterium]